MQRLALSVLGENSLLHGFPDVSEEVEQDGRPIAFARSESQERLRLAGTLEATIDHAVHFHGLQCFGHERDAKPGSHQAER